MNSLPIQHRARRLWNKFQVLGFKQAFRSVLSTREYGFSPFAIYQDHIIKKDGLNLFFSSRPFTEFGVLGRDSGANEYLFQAFFDVSAARCDFSDRIQDFLLNDYDYGFVTRTEYEESALADDLLARGYVMVSDPRTEVVLIAKSAYL
jgi:hypothetical protein